MTNTCIFQGHEARDLGYLTTSSPHKYQTNVTAYNTQVKLSIWDIPGSSLLNIQTRAFYRNCHAVVLVFDISDERAFENVSPWMQEMKRYSRPVVTWFVGNKVDLDRKVSVDEALHLGEQNNFDDYLDTLSALTGEKVDTLFVDIAETLVMNDEEVIRGLSCNLYVIGTENTIH